MTNETNTKAEYPPLPDFDAVEQHVYGACRRYVTQDMLEPIHNLMRDYVDADRASRARVAQSTYLGANVAERLDSMADEHPAGSQASSDLLAAATVWRKHLAGPQAAQAVPEGYVQIPRDVLERVQESLGEFLMDHGWSQSDMDNSDELSAWLAAAPSAPAKPTVEEAHEMGAKGAPATEAERLLFEAWMHGHCWALCAHWDGKQYVADDETNGYVNMQALATRRLWAAWRDRAALAQAKESKT